MLLDFLHLQSYRGAKDFVLDSNAVDEVAPNQRVGKSVEQILDRQHRGSLEIQSFDWLKKIFYR